MKLLTESFDIRFKHACLELKIWQLNVEIYIEDGILCIAKNEDGLLDLTLEIMRRNHLLTEFLYAQNEFVQECYADNEPDIDYEYYRDVPIDWSDMI